VFDSVPPGAKSAGLLQFSEGLQGRYTWRGVIPVESLNRSASALSQGEISAEFVKVN